MGNNYNNKGRKKKKEPKGILLNNTLYRDGGKCPACSLEIDKGGRLELKKIKNYFLKCLKCKYTVRSEKVINKQIDYWKRKEAKQLKFK